MKRDRLWETRLAGDAGGNSRDVPEEYPDAVSDQFFWQFTHYTSLQSKFIIFTMLSRNQSQLMFLKKTLSSLRYSGQLRTVATTKNFIGGQFVESKTSEWIDLYNPVSISWLRFAIRTCHSFESYSTHNRQPMSWLLGFPSQPQVRCRLLLTQPRKHSLPGLTLPSSPDNSVCFDTNS